ncbi:MAG: NAD(P)/FAD-dependent oxidoreductase [Dehalococcoidia bacterium]
MAGSRFVDVEVVVIGAGIVGLAVAAELARTRSVLVVEQHASYARETSSHNSGVIHAGIYYPTGSLKHRLCVAGNRDLYAWCERYGVPHGRVGKLIVAVASGEAEHLDEIEARARANDVPGLSRLTARGSRALEPAVPAIAALLSSTTGIVDQMALAKSIEAQARDRGAQFAYLHHVEGGERDSTMFHVKLLDADGAGSSIDARVLVNAAGHGAPIVAGAFGYPLDGAANVPAFRQSVNRGRYYDVTDPRIARTVRHLVYPVPQHGGAGLGVHVTLDLDGGLHLGPDAEWMAADEPLTYRNDDVRRADFLTAARRLLPALGTDDIAPGQVGYRPKLAASAGGDADFLLWHDRGYVHLGGIESPGLTAALPLAREVASMLR